MNNSLALKLIERGVIRQGTGFQACCNAPGLSGAADAWITGNFVVRFAKLSATGQVILEACGPDRVMRRFACGDVITLDGMDTSRLARVCGLLEDGTDAAAGKRRGRRAHA